MTGGWATAGCEFARTPVTVTMGRHVLPATPPDLEAVMARIESGGRAEHAASFAGLEVDQQNVRAIVHRVPDAAFDDFVRQVAGKTCVVVRDAGHSLRELTGWHDRLVADLPDWTARGVAISTVAARHDGAGVEVGAPDVPLARAALLGRYGSTAPLIFVAEGPVVPLATADVPGVASSPAVSSSPSRLSSPAVPPSPPPGG
ncbi:hypothetical protein [Actinoplanes sp. RD1]|uniref:hypothetical protein n=1 Tax=Actinoplanes sp. RD1 TaxID=3064538 RepID=UPI0027425537|nr:hypothetical protein [Actinoplanes sp. RD1]